VALPVGSSIQPMRLRVRRLTPLSRIDSHGNRSPIGRSSRVISASELVHMQTVQQLQFRFGHHIGMHEHTPQTDFSAQITAILARITW